MPIQLSIESRDDALVAVAAIKVLLSERKIAAALGVGRSSVSDWRRPHGRTAPARSRWGDLQDLFDDLFVTEMDDDDDEFDDEIDDDDDEQVWVVRMKGKTGGITRFGEIEAATEEEALNLAIEQFGDYRGFDADNLVLEAT